MHACMHSGSQVFRQVVCIRARTPVCVRERDVRVCLCVCVCVCFRVIMSTLLLAVLLLLLGGILSIVAVLASLQQYVGFIIRIRHETLVLNTSMLLYVPAYVCMYVCMNLCMQGQVYSYRYTHATCSESMLPNRF